MIDLHTHLLPGWDDGAGGWEEARRMAEIALEDGVRKIVLTPHVFRLSKRLDEFSVLEERLNEFLEKMGGAGIDFFRGAEIYVHPEIVDSIRQADLSINGSRYFFLEFPPDYVLPGVKDLLFSIMLEGFTPIISHPERNVVFAQRPDLLCDLIRAGCLAQITAKSITGEFGSETRKTAQAFLTSNLVHLIASDAHNSAHRPPRLGAGVEEAGKIVGQERAWAMVREVPQAILDNQEVPDFGEPIDPARRKKWMVKLPWRKVKIP